MQTSKEPLALAASLAELTVLDGPKGTQPGSLGGRSVAPRPTPRPVKRGLIERAAKSAWAPLLGRGAAIGAGLLLFAGIGVYSVQAHPGGVHVASQVAPGAAIAWLAPTPSAEPAQNSPGVPPAASSQAPPAPAALSIAHAEPCSAKGALCDQHEKSEPPGITKDGKVILNVAGPEALTRLPGVGERRAQAIVKLRERLKRFRRATDLLRVRGIGVRSLKRMLPHLVLDPPAPEHQNDEKKKQPSRPDTPG